MNFHRFIEEQDLDEKEELRKKTEKKLGFSLTQNDNREKNKKRITKFGSFFATSICFVCLIVALPFIIIESSASVPRQSSIMDPSSPLEPGDTPSDKRYCYQQDYMMTISNCNLKEYKERNNIDIMFFDVYDRAEEVSTLLYVSKVNTEDIIFYRETIYLQDTFEEINTYITEIRNIVDVLEGLSEKCINNTFFEKLSIDWVSNDESGIVAFIYENYQYVITFDCHIEEENVIQIIKCML